MALGRVLVLLECGSDAVLLGSATDADSKLVLDVAHGVRQGYGLALDGRQLLRCRSQEKVKQPLPPAGEAGVIHRDFADRVVHIPGLDHDRDGYVDGLEEELKAKHGRTLVSVAVNGVDVGQKRGESEIYRVEAEAMFWLAAKCVISYDIGMPSREKALESLVEVARLAKRPNRYSVLSSRPSKVRVISTRP